LTVEIPYRFVTHSKLVQEIAVSHGWLPAARYTNLRDARTFGNLGFLDIDWKNYNFRRHVAAAKETRPFITVAKDWEESDDLIELIDQAYTLLKYAQHVVIVPKVKSRSSEIESMIPMDFMFGYSTPSKYGGTEIEPKYFVRPVHLLGGNPAKQLELARHLNVFSFDCNRFTFNAKFGDYFDGSSFRPHPLGGYANCIEDSVKSINSSWAKIRLN
jgi:hypothetical protein